MFWRSFVVSVRLVVALGGAGLLLIGSLEAVRAATTVTLAWDPSGTPGIAGYRLYYGTSSGSYSNSRNIVGGTTTTVVGLAPGQTYYFVITSFNSAGLESLPSNQVSFTASSTGAPNQAELVWENTTTGDRSIWIMQNGVPAYNISLPNVPIQWRIAGAADFLGNGQADLVWENTSTGERSIWIMQNGVPAYGIGLPTMPIQWRIAGAADFLGTGQADLVWENTVTGERIIWIMQNGVPAYNISLPNVPIQWRIAGAADFLGTGQADLVWENTTTGDRSIWVMQNGVPA